MGNFASDRVYQVKTITAGASEGHASKLANEWLTKLAETVDAELVSVDLRYILMHYSITIVFMVKPEDLEALSEIM